jgi:hypothetical protein
VLEGVNRVRALVHRRLRHPRLEGGQGLAR